MSDLVERLRKKVERFITMEATHTKTLEWEAADRIEQLEAALRFYAGWPQGPAGNIAPLLIDAGYKARAALGEDRT